MKNVLPRWKASLAKRAGYIFKGIDELYKETTKEIGQFLDAQFIAPGNGHSVSNPNRKRTGLATVTLDAMPADDKANTLYYIDGYCGEQKPEFDKEHQKVEISDNNELKKGSLTL
ncbi:hypothetical protein NGB58_26235 [Escherichia coli]|nr:hypothetical protein [Escherichia coli]